MKYMFTSRFFIMTLLICLSTTLSITAQNPNWQGRPGGGGNRQAMNVGHLYGKVVDDNGKGVGYATVQLFGMQFDTVTKTRTEGLISGQITDDNGDFSLEKLPVFGEFTLKISFMGYADIEQKVDFGLKRPEGGQGSRPGAGGGRPAGGRPGGFGGGFSADQFEKDLGNIQLLLESETLNEVTVTAEATGVKLALDRKIYRVDKDDNAAGGTAEDALRNVPSLSVDIDGNLNLRNGSPQLFVDGRPTTLTLDQIAGSSIESVEVITNPSAKYDASGGQSGIVNIVMKKDRRIGYHGNVRAGFDTQGGLNMGGNVNVREGKVNTFLNANLFKRAGVSTSEIDRQNLFGNPLTRTLQTSESDRDGQFVNLRGGLDWFADNRNTITFQGSYTRGNFDNPQVTNIFTDSLFADRTARSEALRTVENERMFKNVGASILFKHLYPKKGKEITADVNFNSISFGGGGEFMTEYFNTGFTSQERQESDGGTDVITIQTDYVNPVGENMKFEAGARASIRKVGNYNFTSVLRNNEWVPITNFADEYDFDDRVYAGYATFSHDMPKWGYMVGLRAESSQYKGAIDGGESTFENEYPLSLFPSTFITYKVNEQDNIQLSYTRRIRRPNFFQLMPFTDFSDSLNLRRGNPDLVPEFTNSLELTYQNIFKNGSNILLSLYYKDANDLITSYQFAEYDSELSREVIIDSYANSNFSEAIGGEITIRNNFGKNIELTTNVNLYNSKVDASNVEEGLVNKQFTWFWKENLAVRLPANFRLQVSAEYRSRTAFSPSSGNRRFRGFGGSSNTAQGYSLPNWFMNVSLRKDIMKRKGSISASIQDVFATRFRGNHSESPFFIQDSESRRPAQVVRVNFSYRFGKTDMSLFKRKNMNINSEGSDMMN